ncbi:holo-[acyl-carrier-protein] synthase [Delftia sp. HK171]|nr:holo-[acyl-carrier-protein] synthase [Delftia sp. HK171]
MDRNLHKGNFIVHGIDIVDTSRFGNLVNKLASNHLHLYFTTKELNSAGEDIRRIEKLASRFAIKEAVMKALKIGWGNGISFVDVEILHNDLGAPKVQLHRLIHNLAKEQNISHWLVSASHAGSITIASAIGLSD